MNQKLKDALLLLRADPRIKKALDVVFEECVYEAIGELATSSPTDPQEVVGARNALEGAKKLRSNFLAYLSKPISD